MAVDPNNRYAYVANAAERHGHGHPHHQHEARPASGPAIDRGPRQAAARSRPAPSPGTSSSSPDGRRVFVANSSQDTISVINATRADARKRAPRQAALSPRLLGSVRAARQRAAARDPNIHFQPRGHGGDQAQQQALRHRVLLVHSARASARSTTQGRQGIVCRLNFKTQLEAGSTSSSRRPASRSLRRSRPASTSTRTATAQPTRRFAWPNQMQSIVIRGNQAYMPNIAASPEGPQRFNNSTHAFVNVLDGIGGVQQTRRRRGQVPEPAPGRAHAGGGQEEAVLRQPVGDRRSRTRAGNGSGYVVSAGSDLLVKVNVAGNGTLQLHRRCRRRPATST